MSAATVTSLDAIAPRGYPDTGADWLAVRDALGIRAFGINAWRANAAGQQLIEPHDEDGDPPVEEAYLVLRGRATFRLGDGEPLDAPAGTLIRVPPAEPRVAHAAEPGTLVLAIGAPLGAAHEPSAWEARALAANPPHDAA